MRLKQPLQILKTIVVFPVLAFIVIGCGTSVTNDGKQQGSASNIQQTSALKNNTKNNEEKKVHKSMILIGQVLYQNFEGGFYGFVTTSGDKYLPSGLAKQYRQHGLILEIEAHEMPELMSTQQFGKIIKVTSARVIDDSKVRPIDNSNLH